MLPVGSIIGDGATGVGFVAASIAVGGFIGHVPPVLLGRGDEAIALGTVFGGVAGLTIAVLVAVLAGLRA